MPARKRKAPAEPGPTPLRFCLHPRAGRHGEGRLVIMVSKKTNNPRTQVAYFFFARLVVRFVLLARAVLAITAFFAVRLRAVFLPARLRAGFFEAFRAVLRAVLRAVAVFALADLRVLFLAAFLAGFLAAFLVAMVRLSSSSVGSGCPVNACRNASHKRSLFVACRRLDT